MASPKHGVYCKRNDPENKVVLLETSDQIMLYVDGMLTRSVMIREFNKAYDIKLIMTETEFRAIYKFEGRYQTIIRKFEELL